MSNIFLRALEFDNSKKRANSSKTFDYTVAMFLIRFLKRKEDVDRWFQTAAAFIRDNHSLTIIIILRINYQLYS